MNKKFYWLKLNKDFFKQHEVRIIEDMDNGKDYILFYLKLLVESISHTGNLRFNDTIPYNDKMLSTITNTNIDIVRSAIKLFCELHLMTIQDDGTIYMTETNKLLGQETKWAEYKRIERAETPLLDNVQKMSNRDRDKSIEIDNNIHISKTFKKPTLEELNYFVNTNNLKVDPEYFFNYYESNGWIVGKTKMKDWKATIRNWNKRQVNKKQEIKGELPSWFNMTNEELKR